MKKILLFCLDLLLFVCSGILCASERRGALVLTFDDYGGENWVRADAVFKKYDAHATFFVYGNITPEYADVMKKLQDAGHSLGLHTRDHRDAVPLPENIKNLDEYFIQQVKPQLDACAKYGLKVRSFAYPNSRRSPETDAMLFRYFNFLRSGLGKNSSPVYWKLSDLKDRMLLTGKVIGKYYKTDLDEVKKMLDVAAAEDSMILFTSHNIYSNAPSIHMPTEWLEEILRHARKLNMNIVGIDELESLRKKRQ